MELQQLFMDLAALVESQQVLLDEIENNVNTAVDDVNKGVEEIKKGVKLQKKSRKVGYFDELLLVAFRY